PLDSELTRASIECDNTRCGGVVSPLDGSREVADGGAGVIVREDGNCSGKCYSFVGADSGSAGKQELLKAADRDCGLGMDGSAADVVNGHAEHVVARLQIAMRAVDVEA